MDDLDNPQKWVSPAEAVQLLAPVFNGEYEAKMTICKRAHAGLIRAHAERYVLNQGGRTKDHSNMEIPKDFWSAEGDLTQNWTTGDFETRLYPNVLLEVCIRAFGVSFLRSDIEKMIPTGFVPTKRTTRIANSGTNVFIGHGRSPQWRELKDFIVDRLHLTVDEFNSVPAAGMHTIDRLSQMLEQAAIAFLVMTAEDEQPDGTVRARENVVHEIGLFQGRHGFTRAIVLLEKGCQQFSNIAGLTVIEFHKRNIQEAFEEVRRVLEREGLMLAR